MRSRPCQNSNAPIAKGGMSAAMPFRNIISRPTVALRAWWRWAGERQTTGGKVLAYGGPIVGVLALIVIIAVAASAPGGGGQEEVELRRPTAARVASTPTTISSVLAAPTPSPLTDRTDCDEVRGTDYRSPTEREWFLANCLTSEPVPEPPAVPQQVDAVPPPPAQQPPPSPAQQPPPPLQPVPPDSPESGGELVAVLPFLFLGNPSYLCSATSSSLSCTTASLDWPSYFCSITGASAFCTTASLSFPSFSCTLVSSTFSCG